MAFRRETYTAHASMTLIASGADLALDATVYVFVQLIGQGLWAYADGSWQAGKPTGDDIPTAEPDGNEGSGWKYETPLLPDTSDTMAVRFYDEGLTCRGKAYSEPVIEHPASDIDVAAIKRRFAVGIEYRGSFPVRVGMFDYASDGTVLLGCDDGVRVFGDWSNAPADIAGPYGTLGPIARKVGRSDVSVVYGGGGFSGWMRIEKRDFISDPETVIAAYDFAAEIAANNLLSIYSAAYDAVNDIAYAVVSLDEEGVFRLFKFGPNMTVLKKVDIAPIATSDAFNNLCLSNDGSSVYVRQTMHDDVGPTARLLIRYSTENLAREAEIDFLKQDNVPANCTSVIEWNGYLVAQLDGRCLAFYLLDPKTMAVKDKFFGPDTANENNNETPVVTDNNLYYLTNVRSESDTPDYAIVRIDRNWNVEVMPIERRTTGSSTFSIRRIVARLDDSREGDMFNGGYGVVFFGIGHDPDPNLWGWEGDDLALYRITLPEGRTGSFGLARKVLTSAFAKESTLLGLGYLPKTARTFDAGERIVVPRGDKIDLPFALGPLHDCSGKRLFFTVKKTIDDDAALIDIECPLTDELNVIGTVPLKPELLADSYSGVYEFERRDADGISNPHTIVQGKFLIAKDVRR